MNPNALGLFLIIATILIYAICLLLRRKFNLRMNQRSLERAEKIQQAFAQRFENGELVHVDIVNANDTALTGISSLVGLESLEKIANRFAAADEPVRVTGNSGTAHYAARDYVQNGFLRAELENEFEPESVAFAGFGKYSHQSTMLTALEDLPGTLHLNIGSAGEAVALQDLMFHEDESIVIAGDDLTAQAVGLAIADHVYVGEQLYEIPHDLQTADINAEKPDIDPGLLVMDVLRYGFILALAAGTLMIFLS